MDQAVGDHPPLENMHGSDDPILAGADLDLRQRGNLLDLDRQLHKHWDLGRNLVLAWCPCQAGMLLLVVPHYAIAEYAVTGEAESAPTRPDNHEFIARLLAGSRQFRPDRSAAPRGF